ncbi:acyltransferase family protein [Stutzerimonas kunmingensis]|uniref:acyltransferase family protein n=1 Tax=Stutzerimonas kunmingensis TaxID=1211807 RepID=UPI00241FECDB|nr:acyltransferase family protein [Stutzerimonas kunmingensis]
MTVHTSQTPSLVKQSMSHPDYRPDIDGLRAVAVLAVVAFHAFPTRFAGGFIGVDIFFVISGFLISTIILRSTEGGTFRFSDFYARRVRRIFPALLLVLSSCYLSGWFLLFADEYRELGKHLASGAGFIANWVLWNESGYFDRVAEVKPLLHLWSLGIEEQFYILWPLAAWTAWKIRLNPFFVALLLALASFAWNLATVGHDADAAFFLPHTRIWELLAGCLLAHVHLHRLPSWWPRMSGLRAQADTVPQIPATLLNLTSLAGALALGLGVHFITAQAEFPGWRAIVPVSGAALLILAGPKAWINRRILAHPFLVWFGLISFPLYLWHWPLLSFARIIESETPAREIRIAAVLLSILLAWLTYRLIERPARAATSKYLVPALTGLMVLVGSVGYATFHQNGLPNRTIAANAALFMEQFDSPNHSQNARCLTRYPFPEADTYGWWFCAANRDQPPSLILLGNSFANHLYSGLASSPQTGHHSILSIGACPLGTEQITDPGAPTTVHPCSGNRPYRQAAFIDNIIRSNTSIRYAIIDGLAQKMDEARIQQISQRIDFFEAQGIKVVIFVPHIAVPRDLKGCYHRPLKTKLAQCQLPLSMKQAIDDDFAPFVNQITETHPNVGFFDQNEVFCKQEGCALTLDNRPIFGDSFGHYSAYASEQVAKRFAEWAASHAPGILQK